MQTVSSRVHVEYVDPDKYPEVARAAGVTKYGTTIVQIGAKKEEAKSVTEEEITGAIIRDVKTSTRTVCFLTGERRTSDRRFATRRMAIRSSRMRSARITIRRRRSACSKRLKFPRIARLRSLPAPRVITSSPPST